MVAKPQSQFYSLSDSCVHWYMSKYFCLRRLFTVIQINNARVFFKFRLLQWALFNLQMLTHMYKFSHSPFYFYIWNNSQVLCLVNKNVGTFKTEGFLDKVSMRLCISMCSNFSLKLESNEAKVYVESQ